MPSYTRKKRYKLDNSVSKMNEEYHYISHDKTNVVLRNENGELSMHLHENVFEVPPTIEERAQAVYDKLPTNNKHIIGDYIDRLNKKGIMIGFTEIIR